jgi:hypothetical protein
MSGYIATDDLLPASHDAMHCDFIVPAMFGGHFTDNRAECLRVAIVVVWPAPA